MAERVTRYYLDHPDLVFQILDRIGARNITQDHRSFRCTCPLHDGSNDGAFAVWMDNGFIAWSCYTKGCGPGNLVTLLMKKYSATYQQSVTWLAQIAGIKTDGPSMLVSPQQIQDEFEREQDRVVRAPTLPNIFSEDWVRQAQSGWSRPEASEAIHMLTGRHGTVTASGGKCKQFSWATLQEFEVGLVPGGQWVFQSPEFFTDPSKRVGWFENRIAIPWRNWEGQCIGFSGRRYDGQSYLKYKTFPGTRKSTAIYGLHSEKCRKAIRDTRQLVLVEGFSDVWRAWSHGIFNVASPGGTEISIAQINLISRFDIKETVFFYDDDPAGHTSSQKMAEQIRVVCNVRIGSPPDGLDPDDLMTPSQYLAGIENAKPV
jgi:DNA primase